MKLKDPGRIEFIAKIEGEDRGGYIRLPFDVFETFGTKGQVKVKAMFDEVPYRGSIANMGFGHMLGLRKDIRAQLGKGIGDEIRVAIELDTEPRTVELPADLAAALEADPIAKAKFESSSYTFRKEHVLWLEDAKKAETRNSRLAKLLELLSN